MMLRNRKHVLAMLLDLVVVNMTSTRKGVGFLYMGDESRWGRKSVRLKKKSTAEVQVWENLRLLTACNEHP